MSAPEICLGPSVDVSFSPTYHQRQVPRLGNGFEQPSEFAANNAWRWRQPASVLRDSVRPWPSAFLQPRPIATN